MDTQISLIALIVSILSFGMSVYFWRLQFRPIVTVSVRTTKAGSEAIAYSLKVMNSGSIPAKCIQLKIDELKASESLGSAASDENLEWWIRAVNCNELLLLQNGDFSTCSFGFTKANDKGFWKYNAVIPIFVTYKDWFGYKYREAQVVKIQDSNSFTGKSWDSDT